MRGRDAESLNIIYPARAAVSEATTALLACFGPREQERVRGFHRSLPGFAPTPLLALPGLARSLGVAAVYVKDEGHRLGLQAFKALGASYAVASYLGRALGLKELSYQALRQGLAQRPELARLSLVSATDGNHGRGLAWVAAQLGLPCRIYLPQGTAAERVAAVQELGAEAVLYPGNYDQCVAAAAAAAAALGGLLVQDTAWPGYEELPLAIMQGYSTMAAEALEDLGGRWPSHVFLQAGVGSMAAAVTACLVQEAARRGLPLPCLVLVEPLQAACLYATAQAGDGLLHQVEGSLASMMAGLCCGLPSSLAWQLLAPYVRAYGAMGDGWAARAMVRLARPMAGDEALEAGESGAAGLGCALALLQAPALAPERERLGLGGRSSILCFSTEGATDRANYLRILRQA